MNKKLADLCNNYANNYKARKATNVAKDVLKILEKQRKELVLEAKRISKNEEARFFVTAIGRGYSIVTLSYWGGKLSESKIFQ